VSCMATSSKIKHGRRHPMVAVTDLLGRTLVSTRLQPLGCLCDVLARWHAEGDVPVGCLVVQRCGMWLLLPIAGVGLLYSRTTRLILVCPAPTFIPFRQELHDLLLARDLLGRWVWSQRRACVVRVRDMFGS
jgi:hypothetical protein